MHHPVTETKAINDVLCAVPPMLIAVENTDLANLVFSEQNGGSDHQAIEGAIAAGKVVAGMMEAGTGCDCPVSIFQCCSGSRQHDSTGIGKRGSDAGESVAETIVDSSGKDAFDKDAIMGQRKLIVSVYLSALLPDGQR